jgi:hypothetical protein
MYEHKRHYLLPWPHFIRRASRHLLVGVVIVAIADAVGTIGYHATAHLGWVDSFLNASMILSGMGPVDRMNTTGAKVFASLFALFSGVMFIGVMGIVLAPWAHRLLHITQAEDRSQ